MRRNSPIAITTTTTTARITSTVVFTLNSPFYRNAFASSSYTAPYIWIKTHITLNTQTSGNLLVYMFIFKRVGSLVVIIAQIYTVRLSESVRTDARTRARNSPKNGTVLP